MANLITLLRIPFALALLFFEPLSGGFFIFYSLAGLSDMLDGFVARHTNSVSDFGSRLDTLADMVLVLVCLVRLLPVINIPVWIYVWISLIALVKVISMVYGLAVKHGLVSVHSKANRITGVLLFSLPYGLAFADVSFLIPPICLLASFAAIQECWLTISEGSRNRIEQ